MQLVFSSLWVCCPLCASPGKFCITRPSTHQRLPPAAEIHLQCRGLMATLRKLNQGQQPLAPPWLLLLLLQVGDTVGPGSGRGLLFGEGDAGVCGIRPPALPNAGHLLKMPVSCTEQSCSLVASLCTGWGLSKESFHPKDEATRRSWSMKGCGVCLSYCCCCFS